MKAFKDEFRPWGVNFLTVPFLTTFLSVLIVVYPLFPFQALSNTGYHDGQRIVTSLCLAVGMVVLGVYLAHGQSNLFRTSRRNIVLQLLFLGSGLLSSIAAYSPRYALYEWATFGMLFLASWTISVEVARSPSDIIDRTLLLFGFGVSLYAYQALVAYVAALIIGQQPDPSYLVVGFDNYRFFNHVQSVSLPLIGMLATRKYQLKYSAFWFVTLLMWWMLTFVSGGRGTFLAVWTGMFFVLALNPKQAWRWFRTMLLSCVAGLIAYFFFYWLVPQFYGLQPFGFLLDVAQRTAADPGSGRWSLWQRAIELVHANRWLGVGPLHFAHYSHDLKIAAHPHNALLQVAAEWGIPALLAFCVLIFSGFRALLRVGKTVPLTDFRNQTLFSAFVATGVAIFVDSMVSGLIVMPTSQLWIALYVGCVWGWVRSRAIISAPAELVTPLRSRYAQLASVMALVILHVNGLFPEIADLPSHEAKSRELGFYAERSYFTPRLWRAGYF